MKHFELIKHNNAYARIIEEKNPVNDEEFNYFEKKLIHPSHAEGFTDTILLPFEPKIDSNFEHNLFYSYLN